MDSAFGTSFDAPGGSATPQKPLNNQKVINYSQQTPRQAHNLSSGGVADGTGNLAKPHPEPDTSLEMIDTEHQELKKERIVTKSKSNV